MAPLPQQLPPAQTARERSVPFFFEKEKVPRSAAQPQGGSAAGDEVQVVPCLFNSASCLWTPPEKCHSLSSSCAQELPPKPEPAAELIALARVKGRFRCDDAVLQTEEALCQKMFSQDLAVDASSPPSSLLANLNTLKVSSSPPFD
ncbi:hypothetical protein Nmel_009575 [Mimus melanotis]